MASNVTQVTLFSFILLKKYCSLSTYNSLSLHFHNYEKVIDSLTTFGIQAVYFNKLLCRFMSGMHICF